MLHYYHVVPRYQANKKQNKTGHNSKLRTLYYIATAKITEKLDYKQLRLKNIKSSFDAE